METTITLMTAEEIFAEEIANGTATVEEYELGCVVIL